ncbi:uncharacterized protein LOC112510798 isoform X2 [Cynara cardunculus var. scolymus]|uniref:Uncharacterized protein n=1 Tax=Cynara cardunculus var. scolymus TaxID=59895 RepID=A0A103YH83_CYNCS|nr:uncharacterized protein LOC112510798 isoform X2 [Cynara cardunculus var. scolymus]KVI09057.1 hypothetical protein Ccrd_012567 [Cynara cardunculus var. scolymus]
MANNHGGSGSKFVSVNLNKLYGQPSHHNYPPHSGPYGPGVGTNRARPGGHASAGGGMVVLSRNRPLQKAVPKLSVPPPLNLPSLRKEYEKIDSSGSGGGVAGGAGSGIGTRPTSSGMGWTKPGNVALQEKEVSGDTQVSESVNYTEGVATKGSGTYMPPSARFGGGLGHGDTVSAHHSNVASLGKAVVLRGEDFPSLRAALPSSTGPAQKQKEGSFQKLKQLVSEESSNDLRNSSNFSSPAHIQSSHRIANGVNENGGQSPRSSSARVDHAQKQEDPLPLLWLNPRSDWADDERDTGHGFSGRSGRDHELPKSEIYWDRDFDVPRSSILPHKPPNSLSERRGQHIGNVSKGSTSEVHKPEPYRREPNLYSREDRESNTWRNSSIHKDKPAAAQVINDGNNITVPDSLSNSRYMSSLGDNAQHGVGTGNRDPAYVRRDAGQGRQGGQWHWNHSVESPRYRGEGYQNSAGSRSAFPLASKGHSINDQALNFGREKSSFSKSERTYLDDPYQKDFSSSVYDERDPFTGNLAGVVKRKKDVIKPTDFHDPVRESFEAELERVQKMQEMERQRIVEEQERALEQARREDEERRRVIMEEEERRRRMEEEAREAAWRAEQERLEAIQKAEEQKIAREEEKRRMLLEEERRKQAAKQKLLELEARIAKREAEVGKSGTSVHTAADEEVPVGGKDSDVSVDSDLDNWEVSQRMVERITTSASSDSSAMDRPFDRPQFSRDVSSSFMDRGKPVNPWKRDAFEVGSNSSFLLNDQDNGHHSPRREASIGGRCFPRKEFYGGGGYMPSRSPFRGGMQDPDTDGFPHLGDRDHRWNSFGDGEPYGRNRDIESEFYDNVAEKYGEVGWGQGHSRGNARSPYSERLYMNSESDKLYSYGRSRYSMKQPRVLPPPSLASVPKSSVRGENELSAPSSSLESTARTQNYGGPQEGHEQTDIVDVQQEIMAQKLDKNDTLRCDSQSSLSVSSPPSSPTHLSHDELDDSAGSVIPTAAEGKETHEHEVVNDEPGEVTTMAASKSVSVDEDEEWSLENHDEMQEQEEYDEDDDGYGEEDEVHEGPDENINLTQEFEHMHLEEKSTTNVMDNLVLGFNEGVEVGIPGDEFERDLKTDGNMIEMAEVPVGVETQGSVDAVIHEPEKITEYSVVQPQTAQKSTSCSLLGDSSVSSCPSVLHTIPSSVEMASSTSSGQSTMPALSSVPSQADLPVKLQFGLFSGPSLIPSPVPAIQIGSIQMPLHLHPPVGPSMGHMHQSQPPLFQFGQLRYTSPVSQGILPMTPQPISLVQPNIHHTHFNLNQNSGSSLPNQFCQENFGINMKKDGGSASILNNQSGNVSAMPDLPHENWSRGMTARGNAEYNDMVRNSQSDLSHSADNRIGSKPVEEKGHDATDNGSEARLQFAPASSRGLSGEKDVSMSKAPGPSSANRGKRTPYPARNSGPRSFQAYEASPSGSNEFQRKHRRPIQRTEFRVRDNADRRQPLGMGSSNSSGLDDKLSNKGVGNSTRSGYRRHMVSTKSLKRVVPDASAAGLSGSQEITSESGPGKGTARLTPTKTRASSSTVEGNLKRNIPEEDVDAPLQSGVVRVFKQPGIECPSDEDDFIEVRSKRQMLNDRREQREKEIKAKSRVTKQPRKTRSSVQGPIVSTGPNKISVSMVGEASNIRSDFVGSEGRSLVNKELSTEYSTMASQPMAPIGTPSADTDVQTGIRSHTSKTLQRGSVSAISGAVEDLGSNLMFETENKVTDNVQTSLGDWGNARMDQQVIPLTQTQLDEAMKPARFSTTHVTSIGDHSTLVSEPILTSSLISTKGKSISSSSSPINSLLAGEKIQFGAVTSPTVLPPSSRVVSHGIGAPGSFRPDMAQSISKAESDRNLFFKKDEHASESCVLTEDCEAEVEAAASAVAVAAIDTDEIVGNGMGPVSVSGTKTFGGAVEDIPGGLGGDQQSGSQSKPEESLSVSLPADLSVETPPISLWPPLPSPQSSSTQMLSHFHGAAPSHFPFYEMNHPMMSGPVFAFGPHDESGGTQSQSQKSTGSGSRHIGAWQNHSGMDSFYGPPAGFTGPFIGSPGGIPGVQAPPHMVVYNHYAPVGQFGQVGLSFMGATYIPSGKQPDWKHDPTSSAREEDMNSMNMVSGQRNPPNMSGPIQHLAPGSPLLPMGSPLTMFDVPPFQTAPDMSVQARWSHVPASPLHAVPMSLPLQQQAEAMTAPTPFSSHGGHPVDQSSFPPNRFSEPQTSTPSDSNGMVFPVRDSTMNQFPDELGLVDSSGPSISTTSAPITVSHISSGSTKTADAVQRGGISIGINNNNIETTNAFKNQHHQQGKNQQYNHPGGGYGYQRGGGVSPKNKTMGQWSHRRTGFHGRYQSMGPEKGFPSSTKVKQIYVAKQPASGGSSSTVG